MTKTKIRTPEAPSQAVEFTVPKAPPKAIEFTVPDSKSKIELWNASLHLLDAVREWDTIAGQATFLRSAVEKTEYVILVERDYLTWTWVKGRNLAVQRGVESNPPVEETLVFNAQSRNWRDLVLIAYGDCEAAAWLREKEIFEEGVGSVKRCRELVTVIATEVHFGRQPSYSAKLI